MAEERPPRPEPLQVIFDPIPGELQAPDQWVMWRYVWKEGKDGKPGKWDKPPYQPNGKHASSTSSLTWSPFKAVKEAYERGLNLHVDDPLHFDGVGFVPRKVGKADLQIVFGDLDKCRDNETGTISPEAMQDLQNINSYCEPSPSGTGLRFIARGAPPFPTDHDGRKSGNRELYQAGHYLTITGQRLPEFPATIEKRTDELNSFYQKYFSESKPKPGPQRKRDAKTEPLSEDAAERLQELFAADPIFKDDLYKPAPIGKRSDAEFRLCARLWEAGFSEGEIYHIVDSSSQSKWQERGDDYRHETIRKAVASAEANHKEEEDKKEEQQPEILTAEEILARVTADATALDDPAVLKALVGMRHTIAFDVLIAAIRKIYKGLRIATITEKLDKYSQDRFNEECAASADPEIAPDILAEANKILDEGRAFVYVLGVWQKRHHGDENLGKGLFLSIGAQSCISSKGVHVHACGPKGSGKSDGAEKAAEEIPEIYLLVGSASPKALYYLGAMLPAGAVVYLDDIGWNDQAAQMFKTCTTFYKEGAVHTVVVDQEIKQFKTAPRIIFWLTTADDQTDEQIRDRLLRIDTTEDPKHTQAVIDFIFSQRKSGTATFDSRELEVCQAIIYLLKQIFIDVVIPFSESIRFEGDPRGATIFADLVSSFAIWRHRIRACDNNGAVIACYEDYKDAETFFNAIKGHGDTKYTPGELRVLQAIKDLHGEATREMIMDKTEFSKGALSDIMNGRSREGQAKYGLLHKCPALTEEDEGTLKWVDNNTKTSRRKKVYRLPADYDIMKAYGKAVYLSDETTIKRTCSAGSDEFADSSQVKNEFGKDIVRKFVEYNTIRERNTNEPKHRLSPLDENNILSLTGAKSGEPANLEPLDVGSPVRTKARTDANSKRTEPIDSDSKPANLVCAVCGADLTGHGTVEKSGKVYCARPGCGYPPRDEAQT